MHTKCDIIHFNHTNSVKQTRRSINMIFQNPDIRSLYLQTNDILNLAKEV